MGLVRQRRGVSELSLEEAYRRWADEFVRYATVLVSASAAADVVADTFADLLGRPDGPWSRARDAKGFLYGAITNRARMHHRQARRRRQREHQVVLATSRVRTTEGEGVLADPGLVDSLDALSVQQRAVIYLTYWDDRPVEQVAEILGVSDGTVRRQLARGRSRLREALS